MWLLVILVEHPNHLLHRNRTQKSFKSKNGTTIVLLLLRQDHPKYCGKVSFACLGVRRLKLFDGNMYPQMKCVRSSNSVREGYLQEGNDLLLVFDGKE